LATQVIFGGAEKEKRSRPYRNGEGSCPFASREGMWRSGNVTPLILNLGTRWGQWLPSLPDRFTPEEEFPFPIEYDIGRDTELVWIFQEETSAACARNGTTIFPSSSPLSTLLAEIIIIIINCNWVVTRWQWLFYIYTKKKKKK
jgi:hypothetical protein